MFCEEPTLRVDPALWAPLGLGARKHQTEVEVSRNEKHTSLQQHRSWFKTSLKLEANDIKLFLLNLPMAK